MQIKTTRDYFIPTRMTRIKKSDNNKCWQGCGEIGTLIDCWWKCRTIVTLENSLAVPQTIKRRVTI